MCLELSTLSIFWSQQDLEVHKTRLKNLTKEHEEAAAKAKEADKLKQQLEKVTKVSSLVWTYKINCLMENRSIKHCS